MAGHRPGLGQHALASRRLAADLVARAAVSPDELVVEIGAGAGLLTEALARRAGHVQAIERDARMLRRARRRLQGAGNVTLVHADALGVPLPGVPFRVVANLPFGITTAVLRRLLSDPRLPLCKADLIVQWEAARKRAGERSTVLSVCWGARYTLALGPRLPASCFRPPPRVDAGVLVVRRRSVPLVPDDRLADFEALVRAGFTRGDLPLAHALAGVLTPAARRRLPRARAAQLDAAAWAAVYAAVSGGGRASRG